METFCDISKAESSEKRNQWQAELSSESHTASIDEVIPDISTLNTSITPEAVLQLINETENDTENADRISVLPLMCGTGKSSALRLKMRQIIEDNDGNGMIVVTDNIDRMRDYLLPDNDDELLRFFDEHSDCITVMTHYTLLESLQHQAEGPILIMSTQRYVHLTLSQIEHFLEWKNGRRSLIVIDERPYFKKQVTVTTRDLMDLIDIAQNKLPRTPKGIEDSGALSSFWTSIKIYLNGTFNTFLSKFPNEPGDYYTCQNVSWHDEELFQNAFSLMEKYRKYINSYKDQTDYFEIADAIFQILDRGALCHLNINSELVPTITYEVLMDNYAKYADVNAKVIVLDGTADLSTEYMLYDDLDIRTEQCEPFKRMLPNLNIDIIPMTTGKTALNTNKMRNAKKVQEYLSNTIPEEAKPVIFSYKLMKDAFITLYDNKQVDWFGRIKGKNDYREAQYIAQVGLNRFQESSYFLFELAHSPGMMDSLPIDLKEQNEEIQKHINAANGFTKEAEWREVLADLEQNMFRGVIRISSSNTAFHFYLFASTSYNTAIIAKMQQRYIPLGGHIKIHEKPAEEAIAKLVRIGKGSSQIAKFVEWHDKEVPIGQTYTYDDVFAAIGLRRIQIKTLRQRNICFNTLMQEESEASQSSTENEDRSDQVDKRKTSFLKKRNWFFDRVE